MLTDYVERKGYTANDDISVSFRWKTDSSVLFGMQFICNNQIIQTEPASMNSYMTAFLSGLSFRENCYSCRYSQVSRVGDITIGDFWGLGKSSPSLLSRTVGISLVFVNTECGTKLWNLTKTSLTIENRTIEEAVENNWNLHDPSPRPKAKEKFLKTFSRHGINRAVKCCNPHFRRESSSIRQFIRRTPILKVPAMWVMRIIRGLC